MKMKWELNRKNCPAINKEDLLGDGVESLSCWVTDAECCRKYCPYMATDKKIKKTQEYWKDDK